MNLNFHEVLTVSAILFAVIDVIGSIPAIISSGRSRHRPTGESNAGFIADHGGVFIYRGKHSGFSPVLTFPPSLCRVTRIIFLALEMILGISFIKMTSQTQPPLWPIAFPLIAEQNHDHAAFTSFSL